MNNSNKVSPEILSSAAKLKASLGVRYWEDGDVNGKADDERHPTIPLRQGAYWNIEIDLETGVIVDWPEGVTASVHYKVCDAGVYTLLDKDGTEIARIDGYVPSILYPEGNGYGDYVIMEIDGTGQIKSWKNDLSYFSNRDDWVAEAPSASPA